MALLVLIVLGATLGWLASILARSEAPGAIRRQIMLGLAVSVVAGEIANDGPGISTKGCERAMGTKEETLAGGITAELVNHLGRHGTPTRLVGCPHTAAIITMKIFVEQD